MYLCNPRHCTRSTLQAMRLWHKRWQQRRSVSADCAEGPTFSRYSMGGEQVFALLEDMDGWFVTVFPICSTECWPVCPGREEVLKNGECCMRLLLLATLCVLTSNRLTFVLAVAVPCPQGQQWAHAPVIASCALVQCSTLYVAADLAYSLVLSSHALYAACSCCCLLCYSDTVTAVLHPAPVL